MKKWEYEVTLTSAGMDTQIGGLLLYTFDKRGAKGWELCGTVVDGHWIHHYFKRPLKARKKKRVPIVYGK